MTGRWDDPDRPWTDAEWADYAAARKKREGLLVDLRRAPDTRNKDEVAADNRRAVFRPLNMELARQVYGDGGSKV